MSKNCQLQSEKEDLLKKHLTFWEKLSEQEKRFFVEQSNIIKCPKGILISGGSNDCKGMVIVKTGVVRAFMTSPEGRQITLYRLYPGEVCVLSASCLLEMITFDVQVDVQTDCELVTISNAAFLSVSNQNVYVENFSYKVATERFSDVMWTMQQILFMSFDKRLAVFLLDEIAKTDNDVLKLTHEQIASFMGSAREVVTRMLKYFANEGLVELSRGSVKILDKFKLRELSF